MVYLIVCAIALLQHVAVPASTAVDPASITIPVEDGHRGETVPAQPGAPVIIHIREAHANADGQRHLVAILQQLIRRHGLRLILVEGGEGDVGLGYLRDYGSPKERTQAADQYLNAGLLSAEAYLDMTSDAPLILWGVEDRALYQRNWEALKTADTLRASFQPFLQHIRAAATQLKPHLLNPDAQELDAAQAAYARETLDVAAYASLLVRLATAQLLEQAAYDEVAHYVAVMRQERTLDLAAAQQEQQALFQRLQQIVDGSTLTALVEQAKAARAGTTTQAAFYEAMTVAAQHAGVALQTYPQLAAYVDYLRDSQRLRPEVLAEQVESVARALQQRLGRSSPESARLTALVEELTVIEHLAETTLAPEEYQRFRSLATPGLFCGWTQFLEAQLQRQGLTAPAWGAACGELETHLPQLAAFYETASQRDEALVTRAVAKLKESGEPLAVLITGGFHAPEMTRLLTAQGVAVVGVTPRMDQPGDPAVYQAALKYSRGLISLDDALAVSPAAASMLPRTVQ